MFVVVGLGNPGKKFEGTRHNLGFQAIDAFLKQNKAVFNFSNWKINPKSKALIAAGQKPIFCQRDRKKRENFLQSSTVFLVKPQTFMNNSGKSVKEIVKNYKVEIKNLVIIHDDIDLPLGKFKISFSRGSAGHKGVESIIKELGTKNFSRLRIGIQPNTGKPKDVEKFVLERFNEEEMSIIKEVIKRTTQVIELFLKEGIEKNINYK